MTELEIKKTYIECYENNKQVAVKQALTEPTRTLREACVAVSGDPTMTEFMIQQGLPLYEQTMKTYGVPEEDIKRICDEMRQNPNRAHVLDALSTIARMHIPTDENNTTVFSAPETELLNGKEISI